MAKVTRLISYKEEALINALVAQGALKFGDFTLKSGRKAPFFLNLGDLTSGRDLNLLAEAYAELIRVHFCDESGEPEFDVLFGPAYKGIPLAVAVATYLDNTYDIQVRYSANRKEAKDHGDVGDLLGARIEPGTRVLIVEDVTTSGKSIAEVMPILKAHGAEVVGEVITLDRCERAEGTTDYALHVIEQQYGFPVYAIVTMDEVIKYLYNDKYEHERTVITDEIYQRLQEYYAQYGGQPATDENNYPEDNDTSD